MLTCCVAGCYSSGTKKEVGVTFHVIPKEAGLRAVWIEAIGRTNWTPSSWNRVCSKHFKEADFNKTYASGIVKLREGVVPSIFPTHQCVEKIMNARAPEKKLYENVLHDCQPTLAKDSDDWLSTSTEDCQSVSTEDFHSICIEDSQAVVTENSQPTPEPDCQLILVQIRQPTHVEDKQPTHVEDKQPTHLEPPESPTLLRLKYKLKASKMIIERQRKKIKTLLQNKRRLQNRLLDYESILKDIEEKNSIINEYNRLVANIPEFADVVRELSQEEKTTKSIVFTFPQSMNCDSG